MFQYNLDSSRHQSGESETMRSPVTKCRPSHQVPSYQVERPSHVRQSSASLNQFTHFSLILLLLHITNQVFIQFIHLNLGVCRGRIIFYDAIYLGRRGEVVGNFVWDSREYESISLKNDQHIVVLITSI